VRDDAGVDVDAEFVECPPGGRCVVRDRRVRLGDVTTAGRLRLDALARYLQDVAADDADETGLGSRWVVRRVAVRFVELPVFGDTVELATFCSGVGARWAERSTQVRVDGRIAVEAVAIWVYVDEHGRPAPLEPWFAEWYATAANGRRVSGRLRLPAADPAAEVRPWPLRETDLDVLGHVNNAIAWAAVEDELGRTLPGRVPHEAVLEYRAAMELDDDPELHTRVESDGISIWVVCAGEARVSARVAVIQE
jgi:acyl-ACP thioesterase